MSMYSNLPIPSYLEAGPGLVENWRIFKRMWHNYEIGTGLEKESSRRRSAVFKTIIGKEGLRIIGQLQMENEEDIEALILALDKEITPKKNVVYERYVFFSTYQTQGMQFSEFIRILKEKAASCEFGELEEEMIRDRFVVGIICNDLRKRLLSTTELTLQKLIDTANAVEETEKQVQNMRKKEEGAECEVENVMILKKEGKKTIYSRKCKFCDNMHEFNKSKCPAFGKQCKKCLKYNHFAIVCRAK
uniref:Uncharacterized protein n=1 Tax=Rhodnius prolixus TaxID=13249 RepID=T1IAI4_RHOPR